MRLTHLLAGLLLAASALIRAPDREAEHAVTPEYVRDHPHEFTVSVRRADDGRLAFAIRHDVRRPTHHVARLHVVQGGRLVASSQEPLFSCPEGYLFRFTLSPEDAAESRFEISDCPLAGFGRTMLPLPGTRVHVLQLADFIPSALPG